MRRVANFAAATASERSSALWRCRWEEGGGVTLEPGPDMHVGGEALAHRLKWLRSDVREAVKAALREAGYTVRKR